MAGEGQAFLFNSQDLPQLPGDLAAPQSAPELGVVRVPGEDRPWSGIPSRTPHFRLAHVSAV